MDNKKQESVLENGKKIKWDSETWFRIEIGRGNAGYHSHIGIKGNLELAVKMFHGTEIAKGAKKRLVIDGKDFQKLMIQTA